MFTRETNLSILSSPIYKYHLQGIFTSSSFSLNIPLFKKFFALKLQVKKGNPKNQTKEYKKMFFHIVLERNMQLHPRHFGRNLRENLVAKLMKDVEGTCSGRHGFVVAITGIESIGKGLIRDGTGFVTFPVKYQCVVFRPFKGEILEAVVTMVNKMGFFAEAGPVQIFVSNHLIPDDMEFQSGDMPNYTTSDGSVKIQKDSEVRLKIIGTRVDATEIFCIGTIKDDFLGVINDPATA
ncbi:S1 domain-containing protein/SHS2_Rpb7-N domain-containing protein [Cephalotus follicularis]|uniref:DNA-directed RNA polymerase subunit n=2 Tax=fabids TaxID=91835 RepID=A0A1Q3CDV3_CEPFO|nr:S1 domain-containing protein/SHS2_Rpb7-N domain-containing protein [Cephalotus follicularis]